MQQAIYTNVHGSTDVLPAHDISAIFEDPELTPKEPRFKNLRMAFSVFGNVLGGALLLAGMLMLPQMFVSLLAG